MSLAPIATDDPGQLQLDLARVRRVAQANRKRLRLFQVRPEPPRGVNLDRGYISWEEPRELSNVTHYNIYADDDKTLFRRVPVGQTRLSDIMPDTQLIWVSAYNEESGLESIKALAGSNVDPDVSGENPITTPPTAAPGKPATSVGLTYESQSANDAAQSLMNRLKISWTTSAWTADDQKNCLGFAVWGKSANSDGSNQDANYVILAVVDDPLARAVNSPWLPTATTDKKWTAWVMTRNADGVLSPVATAPSASTVVPKGVGALDLRTAWNFDSSIFTTTGPTFTIQALSADLIKSGTIKLGGSGVDKPGNMFVYDYQSGGAESMVGWIGAYSGYYGAWYKNAWIGGTDPSNANIRMENGTLQIWDAAFTVRSGDCQKIYTSPTTYDATFGSILTLIAIDTCVNDKTELMNRGMVIWHVGSKVAALVRDPNYANAGSLVLWGNSYVECSGNTGIVRADGGFQVGGSVGQSLTFTAASGASLTVTKGIVTGSSAAQYGKTMQVNVALYPSGWAELYFVNGLLNGIISH